MNAEDMLLGAIEASEQITRRQLADELRGFMADDDWSGYFAWLSDHSPESIARLVERDNPECTNKSGWRDHFGCSRCGYDGNVWYSGRAGGEGGFRVPRFCPNCGARVVSADE